MAIPTYEEMLEWATEADARIAKGELPPFGSAEAERGSKPLSPQEKSQVTAVEQVLNRRRRKGSPLSPEDVQKLKEGLQGITNLMASDEGFTKGGDASFGEERELVGDGKRQTDFCVGEEKVLVQGSGTMSDIRGPQEQIEDGDRQFNQEEEGTGGNRNFIPNTIYGSQEVRDKLYLYAWSLLQDRAAAVDKDHQ
ncbi:unnamed protein product [Choristocarpus tenellus]